MEILITINDVAHIFGVRRSTVVQWYQQGRIKAGNPGAPGAPLFRREEVMLSYINTSIHRSLKH
jgi:excisionase family DNA binding protein